MPLVEDLTAGPIPAGSALLVEFDPASQWLNASLTIAAGWLRTGGRVLYDVLSQPPNDVRSQLKRLGLDAEALEKEEKLWIRDAYTATLGQKSNEKYAADSSRVADLSIWFSKEYMQGPLVSDTLAIADNCSVLNRFNEEKSWVQFELARVIPATKSRKASLINGIIRGIHSEWALRQLEGGVDGIVDFKLEEASEGETIDLMRIRTMRGVGFYRGWHRLKIGENLEVTLEKQSKEWASGLSSLRERGERQGVIGKEEIEARLNEIDGKINRCLASARVLPLEKRTPKFLEDMHAWEHRKRRCIELTHEFHAHAAADPSFENEDAWNEHIGHINSLGRECLEEDWKPIEQISWKSR